MDKCPNGLEEKILDKKAPSSEKKRSLFWIVLIFLVMMMGALGWQAKSLLQKPEPAPAPSTVWAKVPPPPAPTTIQIPQPTPDATTASQDKEQPGSQTDGASSRKKVASEPTDKEAPAPGEAPDTTATQEAATTTTDTKAIDKKVVESVDEAVQAVKETADALTPSTETPIRTAETETTQPAQPEPAKAPAPAAPAKQAAGPEMERKKQAPYTIQVGAFRVKAHAMATKAKLASKGYSSYIYETMGANKKPWYGVRFGQFETRDQANQALAAFKTKEKMDGMVTRSNAL